MAWKAGLAGDVSFYRVIDAGFLELTRLGELSPHDGDVQASPPVVDSVLESPTASGPGWHRYGIKPTGSTDGYGDCYKPDPTACAPTGEPWYTHAVGSGHLWPLLDGERAEQELQTGDYAMAAALAISMQRMTSGLGYVPEQVWEDRDVPASPYGSNPTTASIGFLNGKAAGSAAPLIWGQAQYLRLIRDVTTRRLLDQPSITRARYLGITRGASRGAAHDQLAGARCDGHGCEHGGQGDHCARRGGGRRGRAAKLFNGFHARCHHGREIGWCLQGQGPHAVWVKRDYGHSDGWEACHRVGAGDGERRLKRHGRRPNHLEDRLCAISRLNMRSEIPQSAAIH